MPWLFLVFRIPCHDQISDNIVTLAACFCVALCGRGAFVFDQNGAFCRERRSERRCGAGIGHTFASCDLWPRWARAMEIHVELHVGAWEASCCCCCCPRRNRVCVLASNNPAWPCSAPTTNTLGRTTTARCWIQGACCCI